MSLTHKALSAMGIEPEKIDQILEMHRETLDSIKADKDKALEEIKTLKEEAGKVEELQKKLEKLEDTSEKYKSLKDEYDKYKNDVTAKETKAAKTKAYRDMLKEIGVSEKRIDTVMKVADLNSFELEDGKIKDVDKLKEDAKNEWSDFIGKEGVQGAETPTPPANNGGTPPQTSEASKRALAYMKDRYGTKEE